MRTDLVGQPGQVLGVGDVQLDQRRRLGQPLGDPLDQRQPPVPGEHDGGALLLGQPGHRERDRGVGDDAGDQQTLAGEQS
jgi:hypothetical protein